MQKPKNFAGSYAWLEPNFSTFHINATLTILHHTHDIPLTHTHHSTDIHHRNQNKIKLCNRRALSAHLTNPLADIC